MRRKALVCSEERKDEATATNIMNEKVEVLEKEYQSDTVQIFARRIVFGRKPM